MKQQQNIKNDNNDEKNKKTKNKKNPLDTRHGKAKSDQTQIKKRQRRANTITYGDDGKHHLGHVEGVPPVVVRHVAVVFLDGEQPAAQDVVLDMEASHEVQVDEHAQTGLAVVVTLR